MLTSSHRDGNHRGVCTAEQISPQPVCGDYAVTHTVSWNDLHTEGLIFGKDYAAGGVNYTLRAPSVGSDRTGLKSPSVARHKSTNGISYWTRTTDISKTGSGWLRGARHQTDNSTPVPCGSRVPLGPRLGVQLVLVPERHTSVSAPSLKS